MHLLALAVTLSTYHVEGDAVPDGSDYIDVPFAVPDGTVEIRVAKTYTTGADILDFGVFAQDGSFRGWSGGLLDDIVIGVDQSSRGYVPGPIASGMWTVSIGKAQLTATGVHYAIDVTCSDTATLPVLAKAPFAPVVLDATRRWFKGDFHVHSFQSGDSVAALQDDIDLAHAQGLDFINLSDHNTIAQHALVAAQQASWPVLVLRSSEVTTYSGHGNAVGIASYVDHRLGHAGRTMQNVIDDVAAQGAAFIVNHPAENLGANCIGCAWQHAEVNWDEVAGLEVITSGYTVGVLAFTPAIVKMWDQLEDEGHRLAAVTGSDDHRAGANEGSTGSPIGQPCTLVLADELSEAAIVDGVRRHKTIAQLRGPADPLVALTMKTKTGAAAEIGDDVDAIAHVELDVHVTAGSGTFVQIWRDGVKVVQQAVTSDDFAWTYKDTPGAADHRYRAELVDDTNQRVVITSHIYAHGVRAGCSAGGGTSPLMVAVALLAIRRRARSRRRRSSRA